MRGLDYRYWKGAGKRKIKKMWWDEKGNSSLRLKPPALWVGVHIGEGARNKGSSAKALGAQ